MQKILSKYSDETFYRMGDYSQFTIDFIEELDDEYNSFIEENEDKRLDVFMQAALYKIENILVVLKDSEDKELFENLKQDIETCKI